MVGPDTHRIVIEELRHIPRGSIAQNAFRAAFSAYREHDLRMNEELPASSALWEAESLVCQSLAGFIPEFDREYFFSPVSSPALLSQCRC